MLKKQKGFTLIELIFAIIILGVIFAMTVPNFIRNSKNSSAIDFAQELKVLTNALQNIAEVSNKNYGHYPHPLWVDYAKVETDKANNNIDKSKSGIPYTSNIDKSYKDYYYQINLVAQVDKSNVTKYFNNQPIGNSDTTGNKPLILTDDVVKTLKSQFGNNSNLKAYPLDLTLLNVYSKIPTSLSYPKEKLNGYGNNKVQNKSVINLPLNQIFVEKVVAGTGTDNNDRIKNDGVIEKPGYFLLIEQGNSMTIFYTGTDVIYNNQYIHTANFIESKAQIDLSTKTGQLFDFTTFDSTKWKLIGSAKYNSDYITLTEALTNQYGALEYQGKVDHYNFIAEFSYLSGGGTGADETFLVWGADSIEYEYSGNLNPIRNGYRLSIDEHLNPTEDPSANNLHIDEFKNGIIKKVYSKELPFNVDDSTWRNYKIVMDNGNVKVYVNGVIHLDYTISNYNVKHYKFGFTSRTAASTNIHRIDNVKITSF